LNPKRTNDVLRKPDNSKSYRQTIFPTDNFPDSVFFPTEFFSGELFFAAAFDGKTISQAPVPEGD
jgi:hypothetical protein